MRALAAMTAAILLVPALATPAVAVGEERIGPHGTALAPFQLAQNTGSGGEPTGAELLFWESVKNSQYPEELQAYLDSYPDGAFAPLARSRLKRLSGPEETPAAPAAASGDLPADASPAADSSRTAESLEAALGLDRQERRRIQQRLAALGFDPGPADGLFGRGTRGAIGRWQSSQGDEPTGYMDAEAAKTLLAVTEPPAEAATGERPTTGQPVRESVPTALHALSRALTAAREVESDILRIAVIAPVAEVLARAGDPEKAAQVRSEAFEIVQRMRGGNEDRDTIGWAYQIIVSAQAEAGNLRDAVATAKRIDIPRFQIIANLSISKAYADAGAAEEAARFISKALEAAERSEDFFGRVLSLTSVARTQAEIGDIQGASRSIAKALAMPMDEEGDHSKALLFSGIAAVQAQIGDSQGAARHFLKALSAAERYERGDYGGTGGAFSSIVRDQAEAGMFRDAWKTMERIGGKTYRSSALVGIARGQAETGAIGDALATTAKIEDEDIRDRALTDIAKAQAEVGDFQAALATAETIGGRYNFAKALASIVLEQLKLAGAPSQTGQH